MPTWHRGRCCAPGTVATALVLAPLLEVVEQILSPLTGASTRADVLAAAGHQAMFNGAVLVGAVATVLYVPALVGLGTRCVAHSPVAARLGAAASVVCMTGFMAVRAVQAFEPRAVGAGQTADATAHLVDHLSTNPIGVVALVMFLGGSIVALVALAVAAWRAGLPRPAAVMLGIFPFLDLALSGHAATTATHVLLLVALAWLARGLMSSPTTETVDKEPVVAQSV